MAAPARKVIKPVMKPKQPSMAPRGSVLAAMKKEKASHLSAYNEDCYLEGEHEDPQKLTDAFSGLDPNILDAVAINLTDDMEQQLQLWPEKESEAWCAKLSLLAGRYWRIGHRFGFPCFKSENVPMMGDDVGIEQPTYIVRCNDGKEFVHCWVVTTSLQTPTSEQHLIAFGPDSAGSVTPVVLHCPYWAKKASKLVAYTYQAYIYLENSRALYMPVNRRRSTFL